MYDKKTNIFSNNIKRMRCDNFFITLTHPFVLLFFTILLNDQLCFRIMLATCMSFPVAVLMMRALNI